MKWRGAMNRHSILKLIVMMAFPLVLLSLAPADQLAEDLGWVVACEVFDNQTTASATASELAILTNVETGILWIPDWSTLSGYNGWLVYLGPFEEEAWAAEAACLLLWKYPDVYAIHVGSAGGRITAPPEVLEFHDILGLVPPSPGYYRIPEEPEGWEIEYFPPDVGEVDEWEQPLLITSRLLGWEIEKWVDLYNGSVELRARRILNDDQDPVEIYMRDSRFLKESACMARAAIIEEEGIYTLLHRYPDEQHRKGDCDFWVGLTDDGIEYGYRVRAFYGEMIYSWPFLPESAHEDCVIPELIGSWQEAVDYLIPILKEDGMYDPPFPENISIIETHLDNLPEDACRDYYDITLSELHNAELTITPNGEPIRWSFRVYRRGEIIVYNPEIGIFIHYEDYIDPNAVYM